jgi:hypothetical protein
MHHQYHSVSRHNGRLNSQQWQRPGSSGQNDIVSQISGIFGFDRVHLAIIISGQWSLNAAAGSEGDLVTGTMANA